GHDDQRQPRGHPGGAPADRPGGAQRYGPDRSRGPGPAPLRIPVQRRDGAGAGPEEIGGQPAIRAGAETAQGSPVDDPRADGGLAMTARSERDGHAGVGLSSDERDPIELLADEFLGEIRSGGRPAIEEYAARYPDLADAIRDLFPALLMMENLDKGAPDATGPCAPG